MSVDYFKSKAFENDEDSSFQNIFLSVGTPHNEIQLTYIENLKSLFRSKKINLLTLETWDDTNPLKPIYNLMSDCIGCIVLLTERYFVEKGVLKKGSKNEKSIEFESFTTPWCQIEAAMAYSMDRDLLIIRDKDVNADGLFDESIKTFQQVVVDISNFEEWNSSDKAYILNNYIIKVRANTHFKQSIKMNEKRTINIFLSYSSKDSDLMDLISGGLKDHLSQNRDFKFQLWDDRSIQMGDNWKSEIEAAMKTSEVCILLVSASFASSTFINENELANFLKESSNGICLIIPVLVRSYSFSNFETLSKLQFFKPYNKDYGFNRPIEKNKLLPFDRLGDDENTTDYTLNLYYKNLSDKILSSAKAKFD